MKMMKVSIELSSCEEDHEILYTQLTDKTAKKMKFRDVAGIGLYPWGRGEEGTPLFGLYWDVLLDRVWFYGLTVLNRVYNFTRLCPKQGQNLSFNRVWYYEPRDVNGP